MRLAILSESLADEAGVKVFVEGLLQRSIDVVSRKVRPGGLDALLNVLPSVLKALYYRGEADGLIVVLDSNHSTLPHACNEKCYEGEPCRLCGVRNIIENVRSHVTPSPDLKFPITAVGIAVPAIEAWYLCDQTNISESAWLRGLQDGTLPYTKQDLKQWAYGTDRLAGSEQKAKAIEASRRVVEDLDQLEILFPKGFGALAHDIRAWPCYEAD